MEATISLADELYYYFKYMSLGAKTTRQGINIIGSVSELTLNSALFHTSNSILQGIRAGSDLPTILRQTVDVYGLLHSFVTLGVLKQFHTVTRGVIKPDISKLKHAFLQGGLVIPLEAVTLMGVDSGMQLLLDKKIKEEIMAMNDQTFFTRFLEMYAFILGLRAVHRPTHGLTKARQEALF